MQREPELSREFLETHYVCLGETRRQIYEQTGVSMQRIGCLLQKYGIRRYSVERHGLSKHPLNVTWNGIKERCLNPNAQNYQWYGGKGIGICKEWMEFKPFYDWAVKAGWEPGLTVDRIDGGADYNPGNCRLISHKQQCRNRSSNVYITVDGETHLQCEWEELLGLPKKTLAKWKYRHNLEYIIEQIRERKTNVA